MGDDPYVFHQQGLPSASEGWASRGRAVDTLEAAVLCEEVEGAKLHPVLVTRICHVESAASGT